MAEVRGYLIFVRYLMGTAYLLSPLYKIAYHFFASVLPTSSLMFFLDVSPREAYRRITRTRGKLEMFESLEQLQKMRMKALYLASIGRWKIIKANKPLMEVGKEIRKSLKL